MSNYELALQFKNPNSIHTELAGKTTVSAGFQPLHDAQGICSGHWATPQGFNSLLKAARRVLCLGGAYSK